VPELGFSYVLVIALSLSADCFAVAISSSITNRYLSIWHGLRIALFFGLFQSAMTFLGWLAGSKIINYISAYDHWIAFGLLALVGSRMLWESFHEENKIIDITRWWLIITLSIATSLDALAVGLSFAFLKVNLALASVSIGIVAFIISVAGFLGGKILGKIIGKSSEIIGGIILIAIGIRILVEHL
jgi:manganese efflux pump family protein